MRTPTATAVQAAEDLRANRSSGGGLLAAIGRPPASVWPPWESRGYLADCRSPSVNATRR